MNDAMSQSFLNVTATHNPHRWFLPLQDNLCVGPPGKLFMFGGVGLAAAIKAMERTCERPVMWATAQYLSFARPPSILDLDVWVPTHGKHTSQARVIAHVGDKEILTVNAALGSRPDPLDQQWVKAPSVPKPEDCDASDRWNSGQPDLHARLEVRVARGRHERPPERRQGSDDGRLILWSRTREGQAVDAGLLAIMADHVPSGIASALGRNAGGNSLDNTIRFLRIVPTEWVLCDITITGLSAGVVHGDIRLFAEDGRLMATAGQSMILRHHDEAKAG